VDRLPRLRPLEVLQVPEENGTSFVLRDPEGYTDEELVLSEAALFVAAHCDGEHGLAELQQAFQRRYGAEAKAEAIQSLVTRLDQAGMMETESFAAHREDMHEAFRLSTTRAPAHAGVSYPKSEAEALAAVEEFENDAATLEAEGARPQGKLRGLVAPHIDLRVGGPCTALAYRVLTEAPAVETVIVVGTSHACPKPIWIVMEKPFETPLGQVPVDVEACRKLAALGRASAEDLFFHRKEHSIEFQALFLAALRRRGRSISIVPVLSGSMRGHVPDDDPFLAGLRELLRERGERAIVVAAADMAHVGPRFGDPGVLSTEGLSFLEGEDRRTLQFVAEGDAAGFYASVMEDNDPRRICGLSPIYGLMSALPAARGKVLRYEQTTDDTGTVSFASMGVWG
jgi:AmmeMemoRadiSam system protein B